MVRIYLLGGLLIVCFCLTGCATTQAPLSYDVLCSGDVVNITQPYSLSGSSLYYQCQPQGIEVDRDSFALVSDHIARDRTTVYRYGKVLTGADPDSLMLYQASAVLPRIRQYLSPRYQALVGTPSFATEREASVAQGVVRDKNSIFINGEKMDESFSGYLPILGSYGIVGERIYAGTTLLSGLDVSRAMLIGEYGYIITDGVVSYRDRVRL